MNEIENTTEIDMEAMQQAMDTLTTNPELANTAWMFTWALISVLIVSAIASILFLIIQFFIYKSKFKKFSPEKVPTNLKLTIDIIVLTVVWYIISTVFWLLFWLISLSAEWWGWLITSLVPLILTLIWYYLVLKKLASRHTDIDKAKKIADQTLVFTILFWILYYLLVTFIFMGLAMSVFM